MSIEFDYVVVGAGSGGCPVANRLSANRKNRVLLLEAGPMDRNLWIHIPIGYYRNMMSPLSWGYNTEPHQATGNRSILWPRGRVIGGSSAINGLVYIRGQKEDYDHWRQLGNKGWGYSDVLPYFRKAENQERGGDEFHGGNGPINVSDIRDRREICDAFVEAAIESGIPRNDDFNGLKQEGVGNFQTTSRNGRRCSAATGYLKPIRHRKNLCVQTDTMVLRVIFDGARATGIVFHQYGQEKTVKVNGEIILAGGAVNSPQLLQLSGIGPAQHLQSLGIPVVCDNPGVGADLQDHYQARLVLELNRPLSVNDDANNLGRRIFTGLQYVLFRRGPMTFSAGHVGIFTKVLPESATPDVQVHFIPFSATKIGGNLHPYSGISVSVCQLRPESRGEIMIRSNNPFEHPKITPNYLSTEYDRRLMIEGLKMLRRITKAPAFARYVLTERDPGDEITSNESLLNYAREQGNTIFHPTSTCRMGNDPRAVVDHRLRVYGVQGLRIADCSVMPSIVSGNTNAPAIMIGEKCASMILKAPE